MNAADAQQQIHRVQPLPRTEQPAEESKGQPVLRPLRTIQLFGIPCARCGQPAREMHVFPGVHVITHAVGDRQRPCRLVVVGGAS